jgi:nucleoside-diphosphate-sugar epimerase
MRVVVTGNLGYVGTVMTPLLSEREFEVWGIDTGYYRDCILGPIDRTGVARQTHKDLREITAEDLRGADAIVHLGAVSNDPSGQLDPKLTEDINLNASIRLAELAKQADVHRFVFASSCSVYGASSGGPLDEGSELNPLTASARSKAATERALATLADDSFSPTFLRNGSAYGYSPRLRVDLVVNNLVAWAVTTGKVTLMSDGRARLAFVHIEDLTGAVIAALSVPRERVHSRAFNIGREEDTWQVRDIADEVARVVPGSTVMFAPGASADAGSYDVSFARVRRELPEFRPQWSVTKGIVQLHDAFRKFGLDYSRFDGREFKRLEQLLHLIQERRLTDELTWVR